MTSDKGDNTVRTKRIFALFILMAMLATVPASALDLPDFLGQKPNRKELVLVHKYPKEAAKVYKCSQEAIALTMLFYGDSGQDDNSDAFRHCLWNALMRKNVGKSSAKRWANAHEYGKHSRSTKMDKYNNNIGRKKISVKGSSFAIAMRVRKAVKNGKCKRLNGKKKLIKTNSDGLLI